MAYQPNSYKKFVATAATATLVASAIVPVAFANDASTAAFTDVKESYSDAVAFLVENNFAVGKTDTTFGISAEITRGDAAIIIAKAAGLMDEKAAASGFTDVPNRGAIAVNSLKAAGVINGTSAKSFGWDQPIKRGDVAIMFAKAFELTGDTANLKFSDVKEKYENAVAALVDNKVTNGVSTTQFGTDMNIKRGDFAKFVYALKDQIDVGALALSTVTATNGTVTAKFNNVPETAPAAADFSVTRSINGGAAVTVTPTNFTYNGTTGAVTFTVSEVAQTNAAQTVTYSVKYKDTAAKSGSFTVAATPASAVHSIAGEATGNTMTVIFTAPVSSAVATTLTNYTYDRNSAEAGDATFNPTAVTLNTEAVGPFAAGQVATLTFNGAITAADLNPALRINGFSTTGETFAVTTDAEPTVFAGVTAVKDTTVPVISPFSVEFSAGGTQATSVSAGTSVTISLDATDSETSAVAVQYRLVRPDGTRTSFTNLPLADKKADEEVETFTGSINTSGLAPGAYKIEYRTVNSAGVATAGAAVTSADNSTLYVTGQDLAAPYFTSEGNTTVELNAPGTPARSVTATNVRVSDLDANVANVEYRVESLNPLTGVYTTVNGWTNAPSNDGAFDERTELFGFNTGSLAPGATYRVQVRATDSRGNVSQPTSLGSFIVAPASAVTPIFNGKLASDNPGTDDIPASSRELEVTGSVSGGAPTETVTGVQYSVVKDADLDGSYETTVQDFTSTGVTADDGRFNNTSENFTVNTAVTSDGNYRVLARVTNSAGNTTTTTLAQSLDVFVDATPPVATITPNTATAAVNDFVVTFNEAVISSAVVSPDGKISESAYDEDNYTLRAANGQIISYATEVVANSTGTLNNSFIVTFDGTPTPVAGTTVNVVGVEDNTNPGNVIAPTSYTIR